MCICGVCVGNGVGGGIGGDGGSGGGGSCVSGGVSFKSLKKGCFLRWGNAKLPKNPFPQF